MTHADRPTPTILQCPKCAAAVPVDYGWVSWCERCGWNVDPVAPQAPCSVVEKLWRRLNLRHRKALFDELSSRTSLAKQWSAKLFLSFGIAALIHATTLSLAVLGVWWTITQPWGILPALLVWSLAWVIGPRWPRTPKDGIDEKEFPALYALIRRIGSSVGLRPIRHLVLDDQWNASYCESGVRLSPVVRLGVPLCAALDDDELIALVGHELAHGVNADSRRGFWVGSACATMEHWWHLLEPNEFWPGRAAHNGVEDELPGFISLYARFFANVFLWLVAQIPRFVVSVLTTLFFRDSQRAEYLADAIAARVAGTEAVTRLLAKIRLSTVFDLAVQRMALREPQGKTFLDALRQAIDSVPARERSRLARLDALHEMDPDFTHPPRHNRIAMLESRMKSPPMFRLTAAESQAIRAELRRVERRTRDRLVDNYLISIGA